jgi:hypothetical protein
MTAQADVPVALASGSGAVATHDASARILGWARRLFLQGLAVLTGAIVLGIAEALSVWMGALIVACGLLVVAASAALVGLIARLERAPRACEKPSRMPIAAGSARIYY